MAQYHGQTVVPLDQVCRDFFGHLTVEKLLRKALRGEIALPIVRITTAPDPPPPRQFISCNAGAIHRGHLSAAQLREPRSAERIHGSHVETAAIERLSLFVAIRRFSFRHQQPQEKHSGECHCCDAEKSRRAAETSCHDA